MPWQIIVAVMAAVTMTVGNLVAIAQRNIKRLLAYSSVGQVGFLLLGIAALPNLDAPGPVSALASNGIMLHLVGYAATNMVVFVGVIAFFNLTGKEEIADFAGLADRHPFLAASIAVGLFSLAGLPFFRGIHDQVLPVHRGCQRGAVVARVPGPFSTASYPSTTTWWS